MAVKAALQPALHREEALSHPSAQLIGKTLEPNPDAHNTAQHRTEGAGKQHGSLVSPLPTRSSHTFPQRALPPSHPRAPAAEPTSDPHRQQQGHGAPTAAPSRPATRAPAPPRHRNAGSRRRAGTAAALDPVPRRREERALTSAAAAAQLRGRPLPPSPAPQPSPRSAPAPSFTCRRGPPRGGPGRAPSSPPSAGGSRRDRTALLRPPPPTQGCSGWKDLTARPVPPRRALGAPATSGRPGPIKPGLEYLWGWGGRRTLGSLNALLPPPGKRWLGWVGRQRRSPTGVEREQLTANSPGRYKALSFSSIYFP